MIDNLKSSFFVIGNLLVFFSIYSLIPGLFDYFLNGSDWVVFFVISIVCFFTGLNISFTFKKKNQDVEVLSAFILTLISWSILTFIGAVPFYSGSPNLSFIDSFFESMSGLTTTGATIFQDLDNTAPSILLWRAIMQWLGGIGIVVMAITILPLLKVGGMQLFKMEGPDTTEKILPRTIEVATIIISTYFSLTLLCGFFYWIFGMSIFDSICHAMTTIATGGFSTHNDSIGFFKNSNIEIVASIFIILGSIPFISYLKFAQGNKKIFFQDVQIKGLIYLLAISIFIMFF